MNRLIKAFEGLFAAASASTGETARTAELILKNVKWAGEPAEAEATTNAILERHLKVACEASGPGGSNSRILAEALWAVAERLDWRTPTWDFDVGPEVAAFSRKFTSATVIGDGGVMASSKVAAGFSLQGSHTYYPPHAHHAEESYWIIGGAGEWKVDRDPWFAVEPGDSIYHRSGAHHAMQTDAHPLLAVWLWTSHLDSDVVMIGT